MLAQIVHYQVIRPSQVIQSCKYLDDYDYLKAAFVALVKSSGSTSRIKTDASSNVQNSAPLLAATRKEKSGAIIGFNKKRKKALNYPLITQSNSRQHILRQHTTHERPRSLFFYFLSLSFAQTTTTNNVTTHLQQTIDACRRCSDKTHRLLPDSSAKDLTPDAFHIIKLKNQKRKRPKKLHQSRSRD